ncbi:sensor histidine kinase [Stenotrophomonas mori]|uniref:histidine kinase n=1 Tax=Stenotrophomonas mori TaxID=2871096 RepID=A0ABT0SF99_9GAMM|nr:sensor histidine kinase [Stenotrophomonas mori]MCL7713996.1 sensor histidine kinase N-terminal domain-containing protein [Stenotrophomonas mori]
MSTRRPSLRGRLLAFLALPMLALLLLNAVITYRIALAYSNHLHDRNLLDDAQSFARMLQTMPRSDQLSPQARFLLEYDPDGHSYFNVESLHHGSVVSNTDFTAIPGARHCLASSPALYSTHLNHQKVRLATVCIANVGEPGDQLVVTVGETYADRRQRAQEILLITIPMMTLLMLCVGALVWLGVNHGLRILQPLTRRLAERNHGLAPISSPDVPREILPLIETIDGLFGRLAEMIALQDRFIADAAHQLRSPLAGISLHVDRALNAGDAATRNDALEHVRRLNQRTARVSGQLLALTRAQTSPTVVEPLALDVLVPEWVAARVPEAIRAGVDLGYQPPAGPARVQGYAPALQEALDNLIDNALRYAGRGATVTVGLSTAADARVELYVEDDGPGVPDAAMPRLGERFYRVAGATASGTGLGLAIAREAVEHIQGSLHYQAALPRGLKVSILLPRLPADPP